MDAIENSTTGSSPEASNKPHPIMRCMGVAVLLSLIAIGVAIWWPGHQAYQLVEHAEQNGGQVKIAYNHPLWMHDIVGRKTYLPWYDDVYYYRAPVDDETLTSLARLRGLQDVELEISECSPESLSHLESYSSLEAAHLTGTQDLDSFEWVRNCPKLKSLSFTDIPVPPAEWPKLLALPNFSTLQISDNRITFSDGFETELQITHSSTPTHLGPAEAEAINATAGLQTLALNLNTSNTAFWQSLAQNQTLTEIKISGPVPLSDLIPLGKIPTLTALIIRDVPIANEEWKLLPQLKGLQSIQLDVSTCSPESFRYLPCCEDLQALYLTGNKQSIPLDWVGSCTNLSNVLFVDIPLPPEEWQKMLALPNFNSLSIHSNHMSLDGHHVPHHLASILIESSHLGLAEAEAINQIMDLESLSLYGSTSDAEFWETLGRNRTLNSLELSGALPATTPYHLENIPTLKTLLLSQQPFLVDQEHATEAWQEFLDQRSDVEIRQQ